MSSRPAANRLVLLLFAVGTAGAAIGATLWLQDTERANSERVNLSRLDAMLASVNELAVTQRGYFERGNDSGPGFERARQLTDSLRVDLEALRAGLRSPDANAQITSVASALDTFATTDSRARTNLANDTYVSAADLVFSASAAELRAITTALTRLRGQEAAVSAAGHDRLRLSAALTAGVVGLVWAVGLLVLHRRAAAAATAPLVEHGEGAQAATPSSDAPPAQAAASVSEPAFPTVDLEAASRVCSAMARASSAAELREVLADAAGVLRATGMIVWLGAGEELFPVLGHGYDPRMLARLGPLPRQAPNATAVAWRTTEAQIVSGEPGRTGAVVVPLAGAQGCIGVLSTEVPTGREQDPVTRSIATLFAAQLSTIVAAWPAPSDPSIEADAEDADAGPGSVAASS